MLEWSLRLIHRIGCVTEKLVLILCSCSNGLALCALSRTEIKLQVPITCEDSHPCDYLISDFIISFLFFTAVNDHESHRVAIKILRLTLTSVFRRSFAVLAFDNAFRDNLISFSISHAIINPDTEDLLIIKAGSDGGDLKVGRERVVDNALVGLQPCVVLRVHELIRDEAFIWLHCK